ncbi:MAG: TlpA family protein disulfide reductase [Candidatus Eremiobacteraeota bacterium]|nr:TlpA family protein disulfide reductase [Candidatus Eremiobacteraeota bacterium]MBV9408348.1 TlpA family protein disulfide reductase [Candidatus Eremiobacteraeota bacterium]
MSAVRKQSSAPRDNRKIILWATVAVVVIAVIAGVGWASRVPKAASEAPIQAHLKVGDTAPTFSVATNAGQFDLAQVSTPVLLEVFATWCPHCQRETSVLNQIATKYAGKVAIVAVSGSPQGMDGSSAETQSDVNAFGQQFAVRYPLAFDPDLKVASQYLQGGFPTLVLIDKSKKVTWIKDGEVAESDVEKAIKPTI